MGCISSKEAATDPKTTPVAPKTTATAALASAVPASKVISADDVDIEIPAGIAGDLPADTSIVFVLGGPGSGKGTQCAKILEKYPQYKHLSAGDLLREEVASGSETGKICEGIMKEGKLVPMRVTITLLKNAMLKSGGNRFLIDGFPRALDQAAAFESSVKPCVAVLALNCPEATMEARLLGRAQVSGRVDDNDATIKKRFNTFVVQSMPVM